MLNFLAFSRFIYKFPSYIKESFAQEASKKTIFIFGVFSIIHYPIIYLIGSPNSELHFIEIILRSSIIAACIPLCLIYYWPQKIRPYTNIYWFICITYALPFFATYMFIDYVGLQPWPTKLTVALLWLVLITSWGQFLLSILCGTSVAILIHYIFFNFSFYESKIAPSDILNSFWIVIIAIVFARRKEIIQKEKQQSLKMQAGAIAHEMRTPLATVDAMAEGLKIHLPTLIHTQEIAQEKDQSIPYIHKKELQLFAEMPDDLKEVTRSTFTIIDMMLMNLKEDIPETLPEKCSILKCTEIALHEYALTNEDKELISLEIKHDFEFYGNTLMIKHVFFNLLKNALYYVKAANKGKITIWTEKGGKVNKLYFEDTGKGISKEHLPYVFDQFFTRSAYGTGVGLAFCKMVMTKLGGDITCDSVEGEFTRFTLSFPGIENSANS